MTVDVVVHSSGNKSLGIVVDSVIDIVEVPLKLQRRVSRKGIVGAVVVGDRVTELLDVKGIVESFDPNFYDNESEPTRANELRA